MPVSPPFITQQTSAISLSIQYWESVEGYSESADSEGNVTATRVLYCEWADRKDFCRALLGFSRVGFAGSEIVLRRSLPEKHPDIPAMYCVRADMIGGKGTPQHQHDSGLIAFYAAALPANMLGGRPGGYAYFRTEWKMLPWDVKRDNEIGGDETARYVERTEIFSGESITLPGKCFRFSTVIAPAATGRTIPEGLPKLVLGGELHMKWMQIPSQDNRLPAGLRANIRACVNRVNQTTFEGYDSGTLLCLAPQIERKRSVIGIDTFDIESVFAVKEKEDADGVGGWNTVYRRDLTTGPGFDFIESVDDPTLSIYREEDLYKLFFLVQA